MPESKSRHPHHSHPQQHPAPHESKTKLNGRAGLVAIIFITLLGLAISFFIYGFNTKALIAGGIIGAIVGYIFGHQIDKALNKK